MATQTITVTNTTTTTNTATTMRALPAPGGLSKKQDAKAKCSECARLDHSELAAWADRVGWCPSSGQYRAADTERACDSFSDNGRKK